MRTFIKAAAAASFLMLGATTLLAQAQKNPADSGNNDAATKAQGGATTTDPAAKDQGVGSRPMGPAKDEKPTDPNKAKQPEVKKIEKEGTNK